MARWTVVFDTGVTALVSDPHQWLDAGHTWHFPDNDRARLTLRDDGNLVLYDTRPARDVVRWQSHTAGRPGLIRLLFQPDGSLALRDVLGHVGWDDGSARGCRARWHPVLALQSDSNMVVYCHFSSGPNRGYEPVWSTHTVF